MSGNFLYYGDNLDILRRYIPDESVDLVYLDPPFKSDQDYNVLFKEQDGTRSAAQFKAFGDTWRWDEAAVAAYDQAVMAGGQVAAAMQAFYTFLGPSDMLAYLSMMAPRLVELRRTLKETGSIYLHCDPTASHYLKLLLDAVFNPQNFKAEIIWKRSDAHSDAKQGAKKYGSIHDTIFYYTKSQNFIWNVIYNPLPESTIEKWYRHIDKNSGRRFNMADLTAARPGGDTSYKWKGFKPPPGRYWAYSKENMKQLEEEGRIVYSKSGRPYMKRYLDESKGIPLQDIWTDISMVRGIGNERLGYPTQKPLALLERIISASSNEGDIVLDPFCGCGTTIDAAQKLGRRWIGIDITHLAITLIKHRLQATYGKKVRYEVVGEPVDETGARELAAADPFQFQVWSLGLVGARPAEVKKGADRGVDGRLFFRDEQKGPLKQIIISVKAGTTGPAHVRDLRGVLEREKAAIGLLITMQEPTKRMKEEAASAGLYQSPLGNKFPRLQIRTVTELIQGKDVDYPGWADNVTFKKAPKAKTEKPQNGDLFE